VRRASSVQIDESWSGRKAKNLEQVGSLGRGKPSSVLVETLKANGRDDSEGSSATSRAQRDVKASRQHQAGKPGGGESQEGNEPSRWLNPVGSATDSRTDQGPEDGAVPAGADGQLSAGRYRKTARGHEKLMKFPAVCEEQTPEGRNPGRGCGVK